MNSSLTRRPASAASVTPSYRRTTAYIADLLSKLAPEVAPCDTSHDALPFARCLEAGDGAAGTAATAPPTNDLIRPPLTPDLPQRPSSTLLQLDGKEKVYGSIP